MPHAIELDRKYRDAGLVVLLVHCQQADDLPRFMLERFPRNRAPVIGENTVRIGRTDATLKLPRCALIGVDGTVLALGLRSEVGARIDTLIAEELGRLRRGWGATPVLARVRALIHGKRDFAAARKTLEGLQVPAEAQSDLDAVKDELATRFDRAVLAVRHATESGDWLVAEPAARALTQAAKQHPDWVTATEGLLEPFTTKEGRAAMRAAKNFDRVLAEVEKKGLSPGQVDRIDKLLRGVESTPVGRRILEIGSIIQRAVIK